MLTILRPLLMSTIWQVSAASECDQFHYGQLCSLDPISLIVDMIPHLATPQECQDRCYMESNCNHFMFLLLSNDNSDCFLLTECNTNTKYCWDTQDCSVVVAGPRTPKITEACCEVFRGVTCERGFEIDHFYDVDNAQECQSLCEDTGNCHYWGLHGDVCFLYSQCGVPEPCSSSCSSGPVLPNLSSCNFSSSSTTALHKNPGTPCPWIVIFLHGLKKRQFFCTW